MLVDISDFRENFAGKAVSFWRKYNYMVSYTVEVSLKLKKIAWYRLRTTSCSEPFVAMLVLQIT